MVESNSWMEWSKHVLSELERHNQIMEDMRRDMGKLRVEIATLHVKSSLMGLVAGAVPSIAAVLWMISRTK